MMALYQSQHHFNGQRLAIARNILREHLANMEERVQLNVEQHGPEIAAVKKVLADLPVL